MKALVTGGAGFIGSHVVDALLGRNHRVVVIDNLSSGERKHVHHAARFVRLDIRRHQKVVALVEKEKFDVIFHLAANTDLRHSVRDPVFDAETNILASLHLLEAARRTKVKRFIFSSTGGAIYGGAKELPTPEDVHPHPLSPYGVSKLSLEQYLHSYAHTHHQSYVTLRYANVYGPRQSGKGEAGVVAVFARAMLRGETPMINGDGKQTRDYVFIDDVVRANMFALRPHVHGIYNIGTGKETSVNTIFRKLRKLTGARVSERHLPPALGEERRSVLNARKARRELGWKPNVSLDEGLLRTVEWFKKEQGNF